MQNIKVKIEPLAGKYLCEIIGELTKTESGLFLASTVKEIPRRATVLEVGDDYIDDKGKTIKQSAKVGDIIHFKRVWNKELPKDKTLIFIKEEEIVAVERS